jgi:hypothetical protein
VLRGVSSGDTQDTEADGVGPDHAPIIPAEVRPICSPISTGKSYMNPDATVMYLYATPNAYSSGLSITINGSLAGTYCKNPVPFSGNCLGKPLP